MEEIQNELNLIEKYEQENKKIETEILYLVHILYSNGEYKNVFDVSIDYISDKLDIPVEVLLFNEKYKYDYNILSNNRDDGFNFLYVIKVEIKKGNKHELETKFNELFKYEV